jgi:SAM-dependent methyltransferase
MQDPNSYVLGTDPIERERLSNQSARLAPEANWLLDQVGIQPGARAVDVGCGPLGILDLLAERVGTSGTVVGVEREPHLLNIARATLAERGFPNVQVQLGDATATGLPQDRFDLAHERLVLIVSPQPERVVAEMVRLVRPDGIVALQDYDTGKTGLCYPPHPAFDRLVELFCATYRARGLDPCIGPRLPALLRAAGLVDVRMHGHTRVQPGVERFEALAALFRAVRDQVVHLGLVTAAEYASLLDELGMHMCQPDTIFVQWVLVQAWARKPSR